MGIGADIDGFFGPEDRGGEIWGFAWARKAGDGFSAGHEMYDTGETRAKALIALTTGTIADWRDDMTQGERDWWDAQPSLGRARMFAAATRARVKGFYP